MVDFRSSRYSLKMIFLSSQNMRNVLKRILEYLSFFCVIFRFIFYLRIAFRTKINLEISPCEGSSTLLNTSFYGVLPPTPPRRGPCSHAWYAFGLNPPSQLVIGYHWLAFLNLVHKNL